jgi:hypothetical protein
MSRRLRPLVRLASFGLAGSLAVLTLAIGLTGDGGLTQRLLDGAERRALAGRSSRADQLGLRLLYGGLQLGGRVAYPQAAHLLDYYCAGQGDTLRFDARPLLRRPDVRQALRQRRPGITFRHRAASKSPFYVVAQTDWPLYYAFDLLYIRYTARGVELYDNYFFQPLARRSYTPFRLGKVHLRLNDGLIRVAYPGARPFIVYSRVAPPPAL